MDITSINEIFRESPLFPVFIISLAAVSGLAVHFLLFRFFIAWTKKTPTKLDNFIIKKLKNPLRLIIPVIFLIPVLSDINLSRSLFNFMKHAATLAVITGISWILINTVSILKEFLLMHFDLSDSDNLQARSVYTQASVLERIAVAVIFFISGAAMLMTFDEVRKIGMSMLASAGLIGVIAGLAAQKSMSALFAGIQIAITQPFHIDDVVIVEGEWGKIEEITLTYVVVRIWDQRRLVLPITYFLEKPFQNWTRTSSDLLGTVFLYTDYTVPVSILRSRLDEVLKNSSLWDGRVSSLQVTDLKESSVELRALMSARDASDAWDLRCEVREKMLEYIQKEFPEKLPRIRIEMNRDQTG